MKTFSIILAMLLICQNAHGQSTSIPNNTLILGKTGAADKIIEFNLTKGGAAANPRIKWANASSKVQVAFDGVTYSTLARYIDNLSVFSSTTSAQLSGVLSDETGTGLACFNNSPTFITPILGAATATSINGTTIPTSKTLVVTTDKISVLSATSSAELAGVLSDETGSGSAVFANTPTLITPNLGVASATSVNLASALYLTQATDSSTTGANAALTVTTPTTVLTNASLTSLGSITSPTTGQTITILNRTGASFVVVNEYVSATAANRILTGSAQDLTLTNNASVVVQYSGSDSRWHVVGGSGSGGLNIKGQTDGGYTTASNIQVPHSQANIVASGVTLLETGNGNIVPDSGFESLTSGWTASGGATASANSTAKGTGALGYDWDSNSASQTLMSTSVTIPNGLQSKNGVASCQIKTVSGTATHTIVVNDGTNDISTPLTIGSRTTSFQETKINFVFPASGTIRLKLASVASNEPEIYIDDCFIKLADNIYDSPLVTAWESYTPTITGAGTPTSVSFKQRRNGDTLEVKGTFVTGTVSAVLATVTLPTGLIIDTTKTTLQNLSSASGVNIGDWIGSGANNLGAMITATGTSTALVYFATQIGGANMGIAGNGNAVWGSSQFVSFKFSVPISGWSAVSAVSADQTDYDWTAYTPTFTGFGTVSTSNFFHKRIGDTMYVRGKFTSGTTSAVEARVSLPNGLTTASSTLIPSLTMAGSYVRGGQSSSTTAHGGSVLMNASLGYVTFDRSETYGSGAIQTQTNVSNASTDFSSVGDIISMNFSVPISTFVGNQRAPTLVGSVTSNASNAKRIEVASVNCSASSTGDDFLTSPTNISGGICTFTISSGYSSAPKCFIQRVESTVTGNADWQAKATSATSLTTVCVAGGVACSGGGNIDVMCIGNR